MKQTILSAAVALAALGATTPDVVEARPRPAGRQSSFEANKKFGLGLELGDVSGLTGKYFLSPSSALDFGVGAFGYRTWRNRYAGAGGGLHLYLDYLYHPLSLASTEPFELPLYFGIGGRLWSYDYDFDGRNDRDFALGLRAPLGIAFDFNNVPIDIFVQFAFTFDVVHRYYDDFYFGAEFSVGLRYFFN